MVDVVLAWWSRHPEHVVRDERGATALEWVMVVALCLAAVVLVGTLGASLTGSA
jgi:Flp pilus assembly pilin Flp